MEKLHVTVWNEFFHEKREESIAKIYPEGIHGAIAAFLRKEADLEAVFRQISPYGAVFTAIENPFL